MSKYFCRIFGVLSFYTLLIGSAWANSSINMPIGVTDISQKVYNLHMTILWICVGIGIIVFGVMFYAIIFHRKSVGHKAAQFHESTKVEIIWTIIPFFILIAMAIPATKTLLEMETVEDSELTVKVTGYMWRWHYDYIDKDIEFMSELYTPYEQIINRDVKDDNYLRDVDKPLVLPTDTKIRFLMTANDVIHSWWVPDLAVKKDAIPGFINETWTKINKPGIYRGQCAELCGARHGFMPIVVNAVSREDFDRWIMIQKTPAYVAPEPETEPAVIIESESVPAGVVADPVVETNSTVDTEVKEINNGA